MEIEATIKIDLPEDVLREWEPVAFRVPTDVDYFINASGEVTGIGSHCNPRIILRRRFKWPAWLKCRYLTWSGNGCLLLWDSHKPEFSGIAWTAPGGAFAIDQGRIYLQFPGGDWRTRIEENPNWKGGE